MGVIILKLLVILQYLQGLGLAYSIFYTLFITNNQILLDDDGGEINFNFIILKIKGYKRILIQEENTTTLIAFIAIATTTTASITLMATGDIKNIKVPYYIYCYKSYYTKEKCWMLHPHLKQQAKAKKEYHRLFNKKRKTYKDNNKLNNPIGLITHFKMTANNNTNNLLHT